MATGASWIQKQLIARIGAEMERTDMSARELAARADIPFATFARKLVGGSDFRFDELFAIAEALDVTPSELVPKETHERRDP